MRKIWVLHGPNLNLLGQRQPTLYGNMTLSALNAELIALGETLATQIECFQSNSESELINKIHAALPEKVDAFLFNPAAYTHTSVALRDALLAVQIPFIEIHLSNLYAREAFRAKSYFSDIALGVITGLGPTGYALGLNALIKHFK